MSAKKVQPKLIIHGGAGGHIRSEKGEARVRRALHTVVEEVYEILNFGASALDAVVMGCQLLENQPIFNAGTGSENFDKNMAGVVAEEALIHEPRKGTIGVVALDCNGKIAVGTSTGGKGLERIGRVSDSAMPAGNYADANAGVSCTGIGEDIMEECLAAKIVIRVTDGMSLRDAMEKSMTESRSRNRDLGAIAIAADGTICWGKTSEVILAAYHDGKQIDDTINWNNQDLVDYC